jgi:RimJ/RimL family protein N-acetyltransferase
MIRLTTERLVLRGFVREDRDNLLALNADPAVREFLDMPNPTTPEQEDDFLEHVMSKFSGDRGFWAAEEDGRFIGWFHLRPARDTGECELGYRLRQDAWGRGLATEASRVLVDLAGERVIARTMIANLRSRSVMEKLGMKVVRTFPYKGDGPDDEIEYAIE